MSIVSEQPSRSRSRRWSFEFEGENLSLPEGVKRLSMLEQKVRDLNSHATGNRVCLIFCLLSPVATVIAWHRGALDSASNAFGFVAATLIAGYFICTVLAVISEDILPGSFLRPKNYPDAAARYAALNTLLSEQVSQFLREVYEAEPNDDAVRHIVRDAYGRFLLNKGGTYHTCYQQHRGKELVIMTSYETYTREREL